MLNDNALRFFSEHFNLDFQQVLKQKKLKKNPDMELWIADIHAPYHSKKRFEQTIQENTDCAKLFIAGDFFDNYTKSHYRKTQAISFQDEFRQAYALLQDAATYFDEVFIMLSNHDERFRKYIYDTVPLDSLAFVNLELMNDLIKLIPNVTIVNQRLSYDNLELETPENIEYRRRKLGYIYQHKNVIFTHLEKSNKDIGKVVQECEKDMQRWQSILNFKPYNIVVQAHNHVSAKVKFDTKHLYQIPCLIDFNQIAFDYVFNGKLQGNPPALGCIRAQLNNKGFFDANKTHIIDY
jgi:predicted phosphodiesterase